MENIPKK